jgi:arsenate reductase-like glutaredoxin family protein
LLEHDLPFQERDLARQPLSVEELDVLISDRPIAQFLHSGSALYQERQMDKHLPSRAEAIRLMAEDPSLILRPLVRSGDQVVARPDNDTLAKLAGVVKSGMGG